MRTNSGAVLLNSKLGEFLKRTVGVCRGCLLSLIQFHLFREKIMQETLHDHHASIPIGGRPTCNLRIADYIDLRGSSNGELQYLTNRLVDRATTYGKEASTVKSKIMTNNTNNVSTGISMNGQKLEEVTSFKYLGATLCKDGTCSADVRIRIASAKVAMARLNRIWRSNTISFASKFKLYKSLVTSILLYGCETWNLTVDSKKKKKDPGFRNQVHEETSLYLLLGAQD